MLMSETATVPIEAPAVPVKRRLLVTLVVLGAVLALLAGGQVAYGKVSALQTKTRSLQQQLSRARADVGTKGAAIDTALSPLALRHAKAAQAKLKAGDKKAARTEWAEARALALAVRDLGSGGPSSELVAALSNVEKGLGEQVTLTPMKPMGAG
jgi:hypothetical protein